MNRSWSALGALALTLASCATTTDEGATDEDFAGVTARPDGEPEVVFEDDPSLAAGSAGVCAAKRPACPTNESVKEGAGLRSTDGCAFRLGDRNAWGANGALVDRLAKELRTVSVGEVLADANRDASAVSRVSNVDGFRQGFRWNFSDNTSLDWFPQGISGSADAHPSGLVDGKRVVLVSWYDKGDAEDRKGVRIAFVDVTNPKDVKYRFALLVTVRDDEGRTELDPVLVHAGGIVWYGRYLYVPDTGKGFRVFDMERILRVEEGANIGYASGKYSAGDYRYVIPQVNDYRLSDSCPIAFSYASLDRSTTPPSMVSGEYKSGNEGRLARWYLDATTHKLAQPLVAREAFFGQQSHVQGALSWKGSWYLESAAQSGLNGKLYRLREGAALKGSPQPPGIEDLYHDPTTGLLWGLTEYPAYRYVFAAPLSGY